MFGEIIGLYILNYWINNINSNFDLIELGPGKGTLLKDILKFSKLKENFLKSANITLIDKNTKLIRLQEEVVNSFFIKNIKWKEEFNTNSLLPSIIYSNEFFDCLPIRQFYKKKIWLEKYVKYNAKDNYFIITDKIVKNNKIKKELLQFEKNGIAEISSARKKIFNKLCRHIKKNKGIIITIDYGYKKSLNNFSLQTVYKHKRTHLFDNIGEQDITSFVNFNELINIAKINKLKIDVYSSQKDFLIKNGIKKRKNLLKKNKPIKTKKIIEDQYKILTNKTQMGNDFKVLIVSS